MTGPIGQCAAEPDEPPSEAETRAATYLDLWERQVTRAALRGPLTSAPQIARRLPRTTA